MHTVVVGTSTRMRAVFDFLRVIAGSDSTVLITGESGTVHAEFPADRMGL